MPFCYAVAYGGTSAFGMSVCVVDTVGRKRENGGDGDDQASKHPDLDARLELVHLVSP